MDESYGLESLNAIPDLPIADSLVGVVLALLVLLVLVILWILVLPVLFFLAGVIVALSALLSRLFSLETWCVEAKTEEKRLVWRVQGLLRSARAVRDVAAALKRGESPLADGRPPSVVESAPV